MSNALLVVERSTQVHFGTQSFSLGAFEYVLGLSVRSAFVVGGRAEVSYRVDEPAARRLVGCVWIGRYVAHGELPCGSKLARFEGTVGEIDEVDGSNVVALCWRLIRSHNDGLFRDRRADVVGDEFAEAGMSSSEWCRARSTAPMGSRGISVRVCRSRIHDLSSGVNKP